MLQSDETEDKLSAIAFFLLIVKNYPASANAYDSLAEAYERAGNTEKAMENYKKALELNPDNEHARSKLNTLNGVE